MGVFSKILTGVRGSVREIGESIVDANSPRIYEQELVDAKKSLTQAREDLTLVMAKEIQAQREIDRLQSEVTRYEDMAMQALDKDKESLAAEVAERIASLENELAEQLKAKEAFSANATRLKTLIQQTDAKLREHERELAMAKTAESVYRATQSISQNMNGGGSKLVSARESLERIKQRHTDLADRMTAAERLDSESSDKSLELKLVAAGIGQNVERKQAVLDRIKARRAGTESVEQGKLDSTDEAK